MSELEKALRETVRQLLVDTPGRVDVIIGFEQGTLPLRTTPCFLRDPEQVDRLVWNPNCENNLAQYLHQVVRPAHDGATGKVGIVAKGCDARAIIGEIVERQISREDVVIIGVPCQGIIDRQAIEDRLGGREVREAHVANGQVTLRGVGFEETLDIRHVLHDDCLACRHRNPPVYDVLVVEPGEEAFDSSLPPTKTRDQRPTIQELEAWTPDQRWAYFSQEFSRCIRCYACREACPCCYCKVCFVDQTQPSWFGKSDDLSDVMAFHIVRIFHIAGRCLECGACARACPMNIDLRPLGRKLEKDVREMYHYEAGMDMEAAPPLTTYQPDDPQEFIK